MSFKNIITFPLILSPVGILSKGLILTLFFSPHLVRCMESIDEDESNQAVVRMYGS